MSGAKEAEKPLPAPRPLRPRWAAFWVTLAIFFAWVGVLLWMYFMTRSGQA